MLVPLFTLNLGHRLLPRKVTVGRYDGKHPCLAAATIGDKVLVHNPHNRTSLLSGSASSGMSPLDVSLLNISQPVNALCSGALDPLQDNEILFVGTANSLLAYNVQNNMELFYKEVPDGVNALAIGQIGNNELPLVLAGGNCTIQGFDHQGNDPFWTVTGDNVTTLCLLDYNGDGKQELIVGSEDYDIRVFQNDEIIAETSETEALTALCPLQGSTFGYALANGTVGAYDKLNRSWRIKSKNQIVSIMGFDLNADGVPELITGWSNGKIDARDDRTGAVIFKDNYSNSVAGIVTSDYRLDGNTELICCSTDGEVRGYLPSTGESKLDQVDLSLEQDTIRDLNQRKQALLLELKSYDDNSKIGFMDMSRSHIVKPGTIPDVGVIPADTHLQTTVAINKGSATQKPHVEITIGTTNDTIVKAVMIFAEGIFEGESEIIHPPDSELASSINVPLWLPRDNPVDLHIKVLVGYKGSQQFHVFELTRQLPRFSMYLLCPELPYKPRGYASFQVKDRVQRCLMWVNQNFLLLEELDLQQGRLEANFLALRSNSPLSVTMDLNGLVTIGTDDMALAGDIIQNLCAFLNLDEMQVTTDFSSDMEILAETLKQIQEYDATRQRLLTDMADNSSLVRTLVIRAEDSRLLRDITNMKRSYSELYSLNQDMLSNYKIRSNNHQELLGALKQLNQVIQKAGQLRVGKSKTQLINACRAALKANDFVSLVKVIKTGAV